MYTQSGEGPRDDDTIKMFSHRGKIMKIILFKEYTGERPLIVYQYVA